MKATALAITGATGVIAGDGWPQAGGAVVLGLAVLVELVDNFLEWDNRRAELIERR